MKTLSILLQLTTLAVILSALHKLLTNHMGQAAMLTGLSVLLAVIAIMVNDIRRYK